MGAMICSRCHSESRRYGAVHLAVAIMLAAALLIADKLTHKKTVVLLDAPACVQVRP